MDLTNHHDPWQTSAPEDAQPQDHSAQQGIDSLMPQTPQAPPPRRHPLRAALAWGLIVICTAALMVIQAWMSQLTPPPPPNAQPGMEMVLFGRLAVGMDQVLATQDGQMIAQMDGQAAISPFPTTDALRVAIVAGELFGNDAASERLASLYNAELSPSLEPAHHFQSDRELLKRIYSDEAYVPTTSETQDLIQRHGWFGELAAGYNLSQSNSLFSDPRSDASRTIWLAMGFGVIVMFAFMAGLGLMVTAIIIGAMGKLQPRFTPGNLSHNSAYLEMVAIFLVAFIALQLIAALIAMQTGLDLMLLVLAALVLPIFWPLLCGVSMKQYRLDMGLFAPKGLHREIGAGILGYLAGLPIVFGGAVVTIIVAYLTGMDSEHPASREILTGSMYEILVLILAAVIWAPLVEELIFRAAFYRHMRRIPGFFSWVAATIVTSFIFAAIHPQGLIGIPVLMSIAFILAGLRQWRGSLVAPITAHALHNGTIITFTILLLYL